MVRRIGIAALLCVAVATQARAQERLDLTSVDMTAAVLNNSVIPVVKFSDLEQLPPPVQRFSIRRAATSTLLNSLYASTAVVQALDVHSTFRALDAGAVEGNPILGGLANNRLAFVAVKAAVAASTILATRQIARHSRVGAIVTMVAMNTAYAMVVRHNYNLARTR